MLSDDLCCLMCCGLYAVDMFAHRSRWDNDHSIRDGLAILGIYKAY